MSEQDFVIVKLPKAHAWAMAWKHAGNAAEAGMYADDDTALAAYYAAAVPMDVAVERMADVWRKTYYRDGATFDKTAAASIAALFPAPEASHE